MDYINKLKGKSIKIVTLEKRVFIGDLYNYDNTLNCTLTNCYEQIIDENELILEKMGVYLIRGDNVCTVNENIN
jgi:small nuclear ribonucleoprotein (snRNP)-like protein